MVIENSPSARMQLRSMGELVHPAACCVCGNGTCEAGYLDLGVYFDYEGQMYLCKTCAVEAGETIGLYTPDEVKHIQELNAQLIESNEILDMELAYARPIVAVFESSVAASAGLSGTVDSVVSEELSEGDELNSESTDESISGESETEESVNGDGRSDVSSTESHNFTFQ